MHLSEWILIISQYGLNIGAGLADMIVGMVTPNTKGQGMAG